VGAFARVFGPCAQSSTGQRRRPGFADAYICNAETCTATGLGPAGPGDSAHLHDPEGDRSKLPPNSEARPQQYRSLRARAHCSNIKCPPASSRPVQVDLTPRRGSIAQKCHTPALAGRRSGGSREGARFAQTVALVSIHTVTASPTTPRCRSLVRTQWWSRLHVPLASPPHAVVQPGPRFHRVRWDGPSTPRGWPWAADGVAVDGSERPPTKGSVPAPASWRSGDADAGHPGGDEPERRDGGSRRGVTECIGGRQERLEAHQHLFRGPRTIDELRLPASAYAGRRAPGGMVRGLVNAAPLIGISRHTDCRRSWI
jgi:hypothetical protein